MVNIQKKKSIYLYNDAVTAKSYRKMYIKEHQYLFENNILQ